MSLHHNSGTQSSTGSSSTLSDFNVMPCWTSPDSDVVVWPTLPLVAMVESSQFQSVTRLADLFASHDETSATVDGKPVVKIATDPVTLQVLLACAVDPAFPAVGLQHLNSSEQIVALWKVAFRYNTAPALGLAKSALQKLLDNPKEVMKLFYMCADAGWNVGTQQSFLASLRTSTVALNSLPFATDPVLSRSVTSTLLKQHAEGVRECRLTAQKILDGYTQQDGIYWYPWLANPAKAWSSRFAGSGEVVSIGFRNGEELMVAIWIIPIFSELRVRLHYAPSADTVRDVVDAFINIAQDSAKFGSAQSDQIASDVKQLLDKIVGQIAKTNNEARSASFALPTKSHVDSPDLRYHTRSRRRGSELPDYRRRMVPLGATQKV